MGGEWKMENALIPVLYCHNVTSSCKASKSDNNSGHICLVYVEKMEIGIHSEAVTSSFSAKAAL